MNQDRLPSNSDVAPQEITRLERMKLSTRYTALAVRGYVCAGIGLLMMSGSSLFAYSTVSEALTDDSDITTPVEWLVTGPIDSRALSVATGVAATALTLCLGAICFKRGMEKYFEGEDKLQEMKDQRVANRITE